MVPLSVSHEELGDLLFLVDRAWRVIFGALATVPLPLTRSSLHRTAPSRVRNSALSGSDELQTARTAAYRRGRMVTTDINWDTLAGRLIETRTRQGLTRRKASALAGFTSETTLRRYETGQVTAPREDVVEQFAKALDVDAAWLMYGRGDPNRKPLA